MQDAQLKSLTELCNQGLAQAAAAVSQFMGRSFRIESPRLALLDRSGLADHLGEDPVVALSLDVLGNLHGSMLILLGQEHALGVLEQLLGKTPLSGAPLDELELSTLKEMSNILASACLNALAGALKMTLLPSVPVLEQGPGRTILARTLEQSAGREALFMIVASFSLAGSPCSGSIFLFPAADSLPSLLQSLGAR